ncbi:MAG: TenA family protein [Oceanospirillaceae bacterium]|nr:TenA family protein [Oceanospirillaceae bacterium]
MRPTEYLRSQCQADWDVATDHDFCRELANGTLPKAKMQWYLAQDYKFVDSFVRLLATAIAHAPTLADAVPGAQFLALITGPENNYFLRSFDALEMTQAQQNPPTAPQTLAFQQLMHSARMSGRYELMLAVLVVAEWSYLTWAERYVDYPDSLPFWFSQWIDLHSGVGFAAVVAYFREQLDNVWQELSKAEQEQVSAIFSQAVQCECDFFAASFVDR